MSENHYAEFSECSMKPQEVLEYVSGPIPVPEEGEVLVRMKAAPINPADINFVQGVYGLKPVLPHSRAGLEGCGVVQESRAEGFREGDEVILLRGVGSWSEYVAVPSVNVMKLPVKVDPVQAAMLKVNPLTALRMLEGFVSLEPGDWLVQNAANSGVGRCIIQLAREMGVKTVNFVRRPDELRDELTALGADLVVGEDDGDVVKNTLARLDGKRPVLASNAVGGESAGGALAIYLCRDAETRGLPVPKFQMLIYPVADERMETESMKKYTDTPMWNAEHNAEMWRMYLEGKTCPEASPMEMELPKQLPLTYMEVAELDCLHDEGVAYARRLEEAGGTVELHEIKGVFHGYDVDPRTSVMQECLRNRSDALRRGLWGE